MNDEETRTYEEAYKQMKKIIERQYHKNIAEKVVQWCRKNCTNDITLEEILTDTQKCNFCDVAYELVAIEEKIKINGETIEKEGE